MDPELNLSIIVPVYNCAPYLERCFKSLLPLYQSDFCFEVIFVNDGSTDNSLEILNIIKSNNDNINVISQENQGSSGARNAGLEVAKGSFIQFIDSDDRVDVTTFLRLLTISISNNLDVHSYQLEFQDEYENSIGKSLIHLLPYNEIMTGTKALILGYAPSSICIFIFKKSFLIDNNLRITPKIAQMDVEFSVRFLLIADRVMFSDQVAYFYIKREGSITRPSSQSQLYKLHSDSVIVANLIRKNIVNLKIKEKNTIIAIEKNYNSVVWNLILRFLVNRKEVDSKFKIETLKSLKKQELYPIKGKLKTNFQHLTRIFFNIEWLLKLLLKF